MYVTHKASNHAERNNRNNEHKARGKATTQRLNETNKAGSTSSEGTLPKGVTAYTKEDHIKLESELEYALFTSNLPQEQRESIMDWSQRN